MKPEYTAYAPGKVFLLGEYAVLDGGLAVVVAVEPGVRVSARHLAGSRELRVRIPRAQVSVVANPLALPESVSGALAFAFACFARLTAEERREVLPGLEVTVEFPDYTRRGGKVGLGGSAALVAALSALLFDLLYGRHASQEQRQEVFTRAVAAHQDVQGGRGSGADVAASVFGGVIAYRRGENGPSVQVLYWPAPLSLATCWSGEKASTPDLIQLYRHGSQRQPWLHERFLAASEATAKDFVTALLSGAEVQPVWQRAAKVLPEFAPRLGLPYLTPALEQVLTAAKQHGVVAKPSGAGGGDIAVAVCEQEATANLVDSWRAAGFWPLAVRPVSEGVACA